MNLLDEAKAVIEERGRTHGDFRVVHATIAELWTTYAGMGKFEDYNVAMMMALLKVGRIIVNEEKGGQHNDDNALDCLGYIYLAHELRKGDTNAPMGHEQDEHEDREPYQPVSVGGD